MSFVLLPLHLVLVLMDVAIFFLVVRLLSRLFSGRALQALDRVGSTAVETITGALAHHLRRWSRRRLSPEREEALSLVALALARWALGLAVT